MTTSLPILIHHDPADRVTTYEAAEMLRSAFTDEIEETAERVFRLAITMDNPRPTDAEIEARLIEVKRLPAGAFSFRVDEAAPWAGIAGGYCVVWRIERMEAHRINRLGGLTGCEDLGELMKEAGI